jgi:hypothetical protein
MTQQGRQYNLLIYGIEKVGLSNPAQGISNRNLNLLFEPFNTQKRFNDFDGVILFQGIFELYKYGGGGYFGNGFSHTYYRDELDKRKKEMGLLLNNGVFVCFILNKHFVDRYYISGSGTQDYTATDLCKICLNYTSFNRKDITRATSVHSVRNEFTKFIDLYGAASSYFENYNDNVELREIAKIDGFIVGMVLFDKLFFIPSLIPENTKECIIEYFALLSEALTSSFNKIRVGIPLWASKFRFEKENYLDIEKEKLLRIIEGIDNELVKYSQYKKLLVGSGEILVESVATLLRDGFSFKIDYIEEFREDLKIISNDNVPLVFIEIKGTNRSVQREYINQTDSHRERAGLDQTFPTLLVINTHIKNSKNIEDKDRPINEDQIAHAIKMGVLIVRTLDLLYLLRHKDNGEISQQEIMKLFSHEVGWLKVDSDRWEIIAPTSNTPRATP